jgi:ABC-type amino acid transport substrate-binding protein
MKKRKILFLIFFILQLFIFRGSFSLDKNLKVSIGQLPFYAIDEKHGIFIDFVNAIDKVMGTKTTIIVQPYARSIHDVETGAVDYHLPIVINDVTPKKYNIAKKAFLFNVPIVIYYNSSKKPYINIDNIAILAEQKKIEVQTLLAYENFFKFPITYFTCLECALKKLQTGRIDAIIFTQFIANKVLKEPKNKKEYSKIKSNLYSYKNISMILSKDKLKSKELDNYLAEGINKLKKSGEFYTIFPKEHREFEAL